MAVSGICMSCQFWEPTRIRNRGSCRRYPTTIETANSHWCGEFQHATERENEEPVKRRGRPPKEKSDDGLVQ